MAEMTTVINETIPATLHRVIVSTHVGIGDRCITPQEKREGKVNVPALNIMFSPSVEVSYFSGSRYDLPPYRKFDCLMFDERRNLIDHNGI